MTPEGLTKKGIKQILEAYGDRLYYHMAVPCGFGTRTLDYLLCVNGYFVGLEAKRKGARARKFQVELIKRIMNAGGVAFCTDDPDVVRMVIKDLMEKRPCGTIPPET